jgi:hypothetical protein
MLQKQKTERNSRVYDMNYITLNIGKKKISKYTSEKGGGIR